MESYYHFAIEDDYFQVVVVGQSDIKWIMRQGWIEGSCKGEGADVSRLSVWCTTSNSQRGC